MESISEGNSIIPSIPDINDTSAALLGIALGNENIVPLSIFIDTNIAISFNSSNMQNLARKKDSFIARCCLLSMLPIGHPLGYQANIPAECNNNVLYRLPFRRSAHFFGWTLVSLLCAQDIPYLTWIFLHSSIHDFIAKTLVGTLLLFQLSVQEQSKGIKFIVVLLRDIR
ncbi:hypothetical protein ACN38_g11318 [Penicillium nordicum]|uniref:Uncharacterized protein n=1 Tax=Penicillium nordicum TaxID=229535 RepID=A0A0M8NRD8_9EURO|nr:hypothetical protein ACN38_g11318 [Penicillium nordicum]